MKTYIFINYKQTFVKLLFSDIDYIQADGDYVKIFTKTKMYHIHFALHKFLDELPADIFYRCHRSFIINIDNITIIEVGMETGVAYVDKIAVPVSERQKQGLLKLINVKKSS